MAFSRITTNFLDLNGAQVQNAYLIVALGQTITEASDGSTLRAETWKFPVKNGQAYSDTTYSTVMSLPTTIAGSATPGGVALALSLQDSSGLITAIGSFIIPPEAGGPVVLGTLYAVSNLAVVPGSIAGITLKIQWTNAATYNPADVVEYNGNTWFAVQAVPANTVPSSANAAYWGLFIQGSLYRGGWLVGTTYSINNLVNYNGTIWKALQLSTGQTPAENSYWTLYLQGSFFNLAYSAANTYAIGDVVTSGGASWVCIQAGINQTPAAASAYWIANPAPITALGAAAAADGTETAAIVQSGITKKITMRQIADLASKTPSASGVATASYAAALSSDFGAGTYQTLALAGNNTSWATANRAAGVKMSVLVKSAVDAVFSRASASNDPYTGAAFASGVPRFVTPGNNLATYSEPTSIAGQLALASGVFAPGPAVFPSQRGGSIIFGDNSIQRYGYASAVLAGSITYVVSAFVRMDDGGTPVPSALTTTGDFNLTLATSVLSAPVVISLGLGLYRVYATAATGASPNQSAGIVKQTTQSARGFLATGFQVEPGTVPTAYNPTGVTTGNLGLMVEEGTTNLLTANQSSVETDTTGLGANSGPETISRDTSTFWQGAASLKVVTTVATANQGFYVGFPATNALVYTFSVRLKGPGTVNIVAGATVSPVITLTGVWTRYHLTATAAATATMNFVVNTNVPQAITFYADGLQVEQKAYPTSWILGDTTRAGELQTIPASLCITGPSGGMVYRAYVAGDVAAATALAGHTLCDSGNNTSGASRALIRAVPGTPAQYQATMVSDTGTPYNALWSQQLAQGFHWFGIRWSAGNVYLYVDGIQRATAAATLPTNIPQNLYVGSGVGSDQQWNNPISHAATFKADPGDAAMAYYTNPHDPSVPARLNANADYFIDYSAISAANGGNQAPARAIVTNPAWKVFSPSGQRPTTLPSGKTMRLSLECMGTTEADVMAHFNAEAS
jgi:hypothetical protein